MAQYNSKKQFMKLATKLFALLLVSFNWLHVIAQNISNKGTDFWVGYGHHHFMENNGNGQDMTLYLSVKDEDLKGKPYATVTVEVDSSGVNYSLWWRRVYHILGNKVIDIVDDNAFSTSYATVGLKGPIPKDVTSSSGKDFRLYTDVCPLGTGGMGIFKGKGIHITSDVPIVAYSHIYGSTSSGATMLLPTDSWGYTYRTLNSKHLGYDHCFNWFFIVAKENNTRVRITPAGRPRAQNNCSFTQPTAGVPYIVNLQKGEIYQYIGYVVSETATPTVGDDLTGSMVESIPNDSGYCKKIAVFAGDSRTSGETLTSSSKDNDMQQCFPEHTWGKKYATNPWATETGQINPCGAANTFYKVIAKDEGTLIYINGSLTGIPVSNIVGSFYRFSNSTPNYIKSNKPIMVAQYMESGNGGGQGDPEMVYLSPIEQSITNVGLFRQTRESITSNFVSIIIPDSGLASLTINGFKNSNLPPFGGNACVKNHPNLPGYKIVVKGWPSLKEQVNVTSNAGFNIITYGLGGAESYAYSGGAYFNVLAVDPKVTNQCDTFSTQAQWDTTYHGQVFDGTAFDLKGEALFSARKLDWLFSQIDTTNFTIKRECDGVKNTDYSDSMSGSYLYQPPSYCTGYDTFYIRGCDANTTNCQYQMHVVTIGTPLAIKQGPVKKTVNINQTIGGNCTAEIGATGGIKPYNYSNINAPANKSTRGGNARVTNVTSGLYTYTPPLNYVGLDTFYLKVCDLSCGNNCLTQMYIVTVGTQFVANNVTIKNATSANTSLQDTASIEINAVGGQTPYSYSIVDANGNATGLSYAGGSIVIDPVTGIYTYTPAASFTGTDSFFVKLCDAATTPYSPKCITQKHIVSVAQAYSADNTDITISTILNTAINQFASVELNPTGGKGLFRYSTVDVSGVNKATSNKGGILSIKTANGIYTYTPPTGFTGVDSFYIKVCDASATPNCTIKLHIVKVNAVVSGNTATITHKVVNTGTNSVTGNIQTEVTPVGGTAPYNYQIVNIYGTNTTTSANGITITLNATTGDYTYTPAIGFIGADSFYVKIFDGGTTTSSIIQKHTVYVYPTILAPTPVVVNHTVSINGQFEGNAKADMPTLTGATPFKYQDVYSNGGLTNISSRNGLVYIMPLPLRTIPQSSGLVDTHYVYRALSCNYIIEKKKSTIDKIDSVYLPVVIYKKPVNGIPVGCYGAGGIVGDTVKMLIQVYPKPRLNKNLASVPVCPTDSTITFTADTISANNTPFKYKATKYSWLIKGTLHSLPVSYVDTHRICAYSFDTGTTVSIHLTTSFEKGACGYYDTSFKFQIGRIRFVVKPASHTICLGGAFKIFDSTAAPLGKDSSYWEMGNGDKFYKPPTDTFSYTYLTAGTYYIGHRIKIIGCNQVLPLDSIKVVVTSKLKPIIAYPTDCVDTSGLANFWYDSTATGVSAQVFNWTFGDPGSGGLNTSTINPTSHIYSKDTIYQIKLYVKDNVSGCDGDTTISVPIGIKPNSQFNTVTAGHCINNGTINLSAYAKCLNPARANGSGIFKGPGTSAVGIFDPKLSGVGTHTIWYVYTSRGGCMDSVSQQIIVNDTPHIDFDYTKGCLPKTGIAHFTNLTTGGFSFIWNFDDPGNANNIFTDSVDATRKFYDTRTYNIKLYSETDKGCKDSLIKPIIFSVTPAINYPAFPAAGVCENQTNVPVNTATITNGVTLSSGNYFGNGVSLTGSLSPAVSGYGNDSLTYIATSTGGCADTAVQYILIKARPRIGFSYPAGCLPANGIVQFTDTSKMPDTQTIQSCTWNFGHSSAGNPGTANICSPSHTYPYGTYTIYHTVTSSLGCVTDTTFNATFSISPSLYFNALPSICENITADTLKPYAGSNNLAAVPGNGVFRGPGIVDSVLGIFNPSVAGAGTHTIHYTFTATSGCQLDTTQTITVNARPKGQFTFTPNGCLNASGTVQFDASGITVAGSTISSYNWQFETPSPIINGVTPSHNYADGTYTISLNIKAANSCSFDTAQTVTFGRMPSLGAFTHSSVCENGGIITMSGAAVTNGALLKDSSFHSSKGAFVDSVAGKYDPSIAGYGIDTITYTVTSIGNCKATATLYLTIDARPRGKFTFTPNGTCLDTTGKVTFDASAITVPNSSVASYSWNFGNGTGSGINPVNVYNEGSYTIKLTTLANNTCSFDTSVTTTFSRTPHLDTISLAYICTNGGTTNVQPPKVLNGVNGTGTFSSFKGACTSTGVYDPAISGFGVDTIYYTFTSVGGCTATSKFAATIKSRPTGTFTYSPLTGCLNTNGTVQFDASNFTAPLSSVSGYTWDFGSTPNAGTGVNPTHDYNDGTYTIKLRVDAANGCWFDTSMTATFNKTPLLDTIPSINPCENGGTVTLTAPKILNGASGTGVFTSFKNAVVGTTYDPSKAGYGVDTIYYTLTSAGGCSAIQKLAITVKARPYGTFTFTPNSGCLDVTGKVNFTSSINVPNSSVQKYDWLFENGSLPGVGANPSHNYTDGTFTIKLTTTGNNGCVSDTSLTTTFNRTPLLDNLSQQPICENGGVINLVPANVLNSVAGTGVFSSFKGAATPVGIYDPSISGYGLDTIYYTYTSKAGCSAVKKLAVTIKARPRGTFTFTPNTGCLDANGLVKFDASAIYVPGSSVKTYTWDFEAPNAITGNGVKPTYLYADGTYDIKLNVLGNNNCSFDTMMTQKFSKTPSLDPITIKNVCANDAPFPLTAPNVNNGVAGPTGVFTSYRNAVAGNSAVGYTYTPVVGSYIIDTIYYKFISNNGCAASAKKVININPVPQPRFAINKPNICRDSTIVFTDLSIIKSGKIDSTWWHFYDSTYVNPAGSLITRIFDSAAVYSIYYTAKSDSGCIANDSLKVTVRPQPKAMFDFSSVVCMPQGTVFFNNKSSIDSLGGTMSYSWNFGDAAGSSPANPNTAVTRDTKHKYGIAKDYPVRLVVGSKEYGCFTTYDDTLKIQRPFYLKPIAKFEVTKDTLCEGEFTTFFDTSSIAPGSNLFSWTWDYGDGSTPNTTIVPNATYAYSTASTSYTASLVVRNTQLCESEPATKTIIVYKTPKIDSIPVIYAVDGSIVQFRPKVNDSINTSFSWTAPAPYGIVGLSSSNTLRPYLSVTQYPPFGVSNPAQMYTLHAQGQYNCTDSAVQVVKILGKIIVPNAFSPNGDGINDKWIITSLGDYPGAVLDIYDRYGLKVQHLTGGNLVWDGTINGTPAPVATYYYVIDPGNNMPLVTGWVVLLR